MTTNPDDDLFERAGSRLGREVAAAHAHSNVVRSVLATEERRMLRARSRRRMTARTAGALIAAAAVVLATREGLRVRHGSNNGADTLVTFSLDDGHATRVAVVGEFNAWNAQSTPMQRVHGDRWEVRVPVAAGRLTYAFVVNDSTWTADPGAPRAPERWFGEARSVLVVARKQ